MVAASLKYPDWEEPRGIDMQGQVGPVILGPARPVGRFPGDQRPNIGRGPAPPQAPAGYPGGVDRPPRETAAEAAVNYALPDEERKGPVSGYLYFAYRKKPKSIKSLELIWLHGEVRTAIKLF
jgi:hypothetical protein